MAAPRLRSSCWAGSWPESAARRWGIASAAFWTLALGAAAILAQPPAAPTPAAISDEVATPPTEALVVHDEVVVRERGDSLLGLTESATEGATGAESLARRPLLRIGEILETVPGVILTQHSGGGKANQFFLRGFNLDHGTDFSVVVGDLQVNMPTHGHGQGYADLNFLIPELIGTVGYRKGPYFAEEGDFAAAGAARVEYVSSLPQGLVRLSAGELGHRQALVADSFALDGGDLLVAVQASHDDGPWEQPDDFRRGNAVVRYSRGDAARGFSLTAEGYDGRWASTDQMPARAIADHRIGRFGLIDDTDGGSTSRYALSGEWRRGADTSLDRLAFYALRYDFRLFSNFTYFLDDPQRGDQFEQADARTVIGMRAAHRAAAIWAGRPVETLVGFEARADLIDNGLFHTARRARLETIRADDVAQLLAGPHAEVLVRWSDKVRTRFGLRGDYHHADVDSDLAANSGVTDEFLLSPKFSLALGPWRRTEWYVQYGQGFHSNDARGAAIRVDPRTGEPAERVQPLVRARGADLGVRTEALPGLRTSLSLFALELDSEIVFVGDAGATEASRPSRRTGVELANFWQLRPWLAIDCDVALSRARFTDRDTAGYRIPDARIPGAVERVIAAGVVLGAGDGLSGSVRVRHFGPRDLIEDGGVRSRASTLVNAEIGYAFASGLAIEAQIFNALDAENDDIAYFYASRLPGEPAEGVEDLHVHPAEKRSVRLAVVWRY